MMCINEVMEDEAGAEPASFGGCSHRKLYSEIESEHDYEFFMANSKCSFYKPKL